MSRQKSMEKGVGKMLEYFETLSENQVFMQKNQVEFEKYLKDIQARLIEIENLLRK